MKDLFKYIDERIERKREGGRHSTADLYSAAGNRLRHFYGDLPLPLAKITVSLMKDFSDYLKDQELMPNTVVSYLSSVRAVYNTAVRDGLIPSGKAPFAGLKLKPEMTAKPVIPVKVMQEIADLDLHDEPELELAADINSFSFMACGIPFTDIVRLDKENIRDGSLIYNRRKTGTQVCIPITQGMKKLIDKYKSPGHPFLFPVLDNRKVDHKTYKKILHKHNKHMQLLGNRISTPCKLTSYVQRRTWATEAQRRHVSISVIGHALGHTSEKTTWFYLVKDNTSELFRANPAIIKDVNITVLKKGETLFTE